MSEQKQITESINGVTIPVVDINNKKWYPISYLFVNILGRKQFKFNSNQQKQYSDYLARFKINFGYNTGGIQLCSCIQEDGLKEYFKNARIGALDTEKRKLLNGLLEYLNLEKIDDRNTKLKAVKQSEVDKLIKDYPNYIKDIIYDVLKENNYNIEWKKCNQCGNYYPIHECFYTKNPKCEDNYMTLCKNCYNSSTDINCSDLYLHNINKKYGYDTYIRFKEYKDIVLIYNFCIEHNESFPNVIHNKENYLKIIKYLHDSNIITNSQLNIHDLKEISKLEKSNDISLKNIYEYVDKDFIYNIYKYNCIGNRNNVIIEELSENDIVINIVNYIKQLNISDILNQDIQCLIRYSCNLKPYVKSNEVLYYIKKVFNDDKYPAYKFNLDSSLDKYWNFKENRINELKIFIKDNNIDTIKIPLYITKRELEKSNTYGILSKILDKYYNGDIFKWVNEAFSNIFKREDFNITQYRNYFDSTEEEKIDAILRQYFTNVIYNRRNTDNTIEFDKSVPDWIVINKNHCIIIEYFGYEVDNNIKNERVEKYKKKTEKKYIKYENLYNYSTLYIYPNDLKENNKGLIKKLIKYQIEE